MIMVQLIVAVISYSLALIVGSFALGYITAKNKKSKYKYIWSYIILHLKWKSGKEWAHQYGWTGVNIDDVPDRLMSEYEFWKDYSPLNSC